MQAATRSGALAGVLDRERARLARRVAQQGSDLPALAASLRAEFVDVRPSWLHRRLQGCAERITFALEDGAPLSEAMSDHPGDFEPWELALVRAAERSGDSERVLTAWHRRLTLSADFKDAVSNLVLYPLGLVLSTVLFWLWLLAFVIPTYARLFTSAGAELPLSTRLVIAGSNLVASSWPLLLVVVTVAASIVAVLAKVPVGRERLSRWRYRLPVLGTAARSADRAMVLQTLQALAVAKVPAAEAMALTAESVPTRAGRAELKAEASRLADGATIESGDAGVLLSLSTRRALGRAWAARESEISLDRLARAESARVLRTTNRHLAGLEPFSILLMGVAMGFSLFAILAPIVEFASVVQDTLP